MMEKEGLSAKTSHRVESRARIAVMGAGQVGRKHAERVARDAILVGIVDPAPAAAVLAQEFSTRVCRSLADLLMETRPDGVIVATPSNLHHEHGMACIEAGLPVLIEKPLATRIEDARELVRAADETSVPLLVGHHRRYNPIVGRAKAEIESGRLGRIVSVQTTCWLAKPVEYFDAAWRREPGAGPIYTNLVHDIDLLRALCGEVGTVQAITSNAIRGHAVEESAALLLEFENGAIGTMSVSDTAVAPWSWETTAGENTDFPKTGESCYRIAGTLSSISIPDLHVWHQEGGRDWRIPFLSEVLPMVPKDPFALQVEHFSMVILQGTTPIVTGRDGLAALRIAVAAKEAAATGKKIDISD
jgi:predicted dehydrogenase